MINCLEDVFQMILKPEYVMTRGNGTVAVQPIKDYELTMNDSNNRINVTISTAAMEVRTSLNLFNQVSQYYERVPLVDGISREKAKRMEKLLSTKTVAAIAKQKRR